MKYRMSFSIGGLFLRESVLLASLYGEKNDWILVQEEAIETNLLQSRTISSAKRIGREVIGRLQELNDDEQRLLIDGTVEEQAQLLWLAICRRYAFIGEFSKEVVKEHAMAYHNRLSNEDFDAFFNAKMQTHPELEQITDSTRNKLRQVLFRMMREAEIIDSRKNILPTVLGERLKALMSANTRHELDYFPMIEGGA